MAQVEVEALKGVNIASVACVSRARSLLCRPAKPKQVLEEGRGMGASGLR